MAEKPDHLISPMQDADHRRCSICSQLADHERASQKVQPEDGDTHLPAAAYLLRPVRNVVSESGPRELWQCPECTTCYIYNWEYEFLYGFGGSEDTQELTRMTAAEAAQWLAGSGTPPRAQTSAEPSPPQSDKQPELKIEDATAEESVNVTDAEPGFVSVQYVRQEGRLDMGGRLLLERSSVPLVVELLDSCLNDHAFAGVECQSGGDAFRVYGSGSDQQPIINILNRRPDLVPHSGLSGLMLTFTATQTLLEQLRRLN